MDRVMKAVFTIVGLFWLYGLFVWVPMSMYTEAACLKKGYPKYHLTVGLEQYCSTLNGMVFHKVDKL